MAVCIDVLWVKFTYNPKIRILYLKKLEILDIYLVLENFPSLDNIEYNVLQLHLD